MLRIFLWLEDRARSFPELSLSPSFERRWPSLYEGLEDGTIDQQRLCRVFARFLPEQMGSQTLWIGTDVSGIARPRSRTSADRSAQHVHNLPESKKPVSYGWQFSTVVALPRTPSSWVYALSQQRVSTETTPAQVAIEPLKHLLPLLLQNTISVFDRDSDATWFWCQCSTLPHKGTLIRVKSNRCLYRPAPPKTGKRGGPRKDGDKLRPDAPETHGNLDGQWEGTDQHERPLQLTWWKHLHGKEARYLDLTVIRVVRPCASNSERDTRISWFVWIGDPEADLVSIGLGYVSRFSHEHGYRFQKQALLWDQPRLRPPEQIERWTHLVAIAHNHLGLARDLVEPVLRPWESTHRPATPQQVPRARGKFLPSLGTPARSPHPRGKSPGGAKGTKIGKARRFAVVKKTPRLPIVAPISLFRSLHHDAHALLQNFSRRSGRGC
jgi:hypothetical protein